MGNDATQPPPLEKGLFGYRRSSVNRMISDRDIMLRQAEGRVRAAEARIAELEVQLRRRDEQLDQFRTQGGSDGAPAGEGQPETARFVTEELGQILSAAEESAQKLMERVKADTERRMGEAERMWKETQGEIARFASWRKVADPKIRKAQSKVDDIRGKIEEVPERIRKALAPMADAIASLDADLGEVTATNPPLLVAPTGLSESAANLSDEEVAEGLEAADRLEEEIAEAAEEADAEAEGAMAEEGESELEEEPEEPEAGTAR